MYHGYLGRTAPQNPFGHPSLLAFAEPFFDFKCFQPLQLPLLLLLLLLLVLILTFFLLLPVVLVGALLMPLPLPMLSPCKASIHRQVGK